MLNRSSRSVRIFWPTFDRAQLIRALEEGVGRLEADLALQRVVLFGSHARGAATVASDVDLLIVYRGAPRADAYALARRAFRVPRLEPHLYSEVEFGTARQLLEKMLRGGVTIFPRAAAEAVNRLVDEYRHRCLWFLRDDYYPATDEDRVRVLEYIGRHGDVRAFRRAAEVRQWLLRNSSETSAGS